MSGAVESKAERLNVPGMMKRIPLTTVFIGGLLLIVLILGTVVGFSLATELTNIIQRFTYWSILVLAMVPAIQSGTGPNFALPVGICAGLLAMVITMEMQMMGAWFIIVAILIAIAIACVFGYIYGRLMNAVKGSEMAIATYTGFAITYFFSMIWLLYPITNPNIGFFLGPGLRLLVRLETFAAEKILERFLSFSLFGVTVPTGTLLLFSFFAFLVYMFFRS